VTFLNPFVLFGLIAASIPILLHIINLRRLKTVEFSTLRFLKELQKTRIQRIKIRQILLLILRTLLIVLIVLAFSRPTLRGSLPVGISEGAKTTAIILFDDSESMTAGDGQGELLRQAKNYANAIISLLKEGDELFLVKLSETGPGDNRTLISGRHNFSAVRHELDRIKHSYIRRSIEDGIRYCAHIIADSKNFNREIYIISDFQSGSLHSPRGKIISTGGLFSAPAQIFLVPVGKDNPENIGIESVHIPNAIIETGRPFSVKLNLRNFGSSDVRNHLVSIYQDGKHTAQKGIDLAGGESGEIEFSIVPEHPGFLQGLVEIEDDNLIYDNKAYFIIHVPEELRVLLIGSRSELSYIRIALSARQRDSSANMRITETTWDRFTPALLKETDVILLANPPEPAGGRYESIKNYLYAGGGVFILPGEGSTVTEFNRSLSAILGFQRSASLESPSHSAQSGGSFIEFDKIDMQHPLFAGMFKKENFSGKSGKEKGILESPQIRTTLHLQSTPASRPIISLTNNAPFLLEEKTEKGRALIMSVPAGTDWSDLPLKAVFVPLIHRSLSYLAQEPAGERSIVAGEKVRMRLNIPASAKLTVKKPDGVEILVNTRQLTDEKQDNTAYSDIPGFYSVFSGKYVVEMFAVNIDPDESNTLRSGEDEREKMLNGLGIPDGAIHNIDQPGGTEKTITESRLGSEIWKQLIIMALIIAGIEMLVARSTKRSIAMNESK
jgi:hypothetical protein